MNNLCDNVIIYIYTYLDCKESIGIKCVCSINNKLISCKSHNFTDLYGCETHFEECDKSYVIYILKHEAERQEMCKSASTIHFNSKRQLDIAKEYFSYFGIISHFCCGGTGVIFKDKFSKEIDELSSIYNFNNSTNIYDYNILE